jgi:hypothetical protein
MPAQRRASRGENAGFAELPDASLYRIMHANQSIGGLMNHANSIAIAAASPIQ